METLGYEIVVSRNEMMEIIDEFARESMFNMVNVFYSTVSTEGERLQAEALYGAHALAQYLVRGKLDSIVPFGENQPWISEASEQLKNFMNEDSSSRFVIEPNIFFSTAENAHRRICRLTYGSIQPRRKNETDQNFIEDIANKQALIDSAGVQFLFF